MAMEILPPFIEIANDIETRRACSLSPMVGGMVLAQDYDHHEVDVHRATFEHRTNEQGRMDREARGDDRKCRNKMIRVSVDVAKKVMQKHGVDLAEHLVNRRVIAYWSNIVN